jgi:hypothetical protein
MNNLIYEQWRPMFCERLETLSPQSQVHGLR